MERQKIYIIFTILLMVTILIACKAQDSAGVPEVKSVFTFSKLSDDDFKEVGAEDATKDDFRKVNFYVNVKYSADMSDRKIYLPDLKAIMNSYDIERYWYGQYSSKDTPGEDAEYRNDIMFFSKDLTDEEIKSIFEDAKINVTWSNKDGKEEMRTIILSEIIVFQ